MCGVNPVHARLWAQPLDEVCFRHDIITRPRIAAFLAQVCHESAYFTHTEEGLFYTTPERIRAMWPTRVPTMQDAASLIRRPQALANRVYANRLGNGDESSGEGWAFRGRGPIQITGKTNYKVAGDAIGVDYIRSPELVALPLDGARTAGWFWSSAHCNELADNSDIDGITRRINGAAMVGAAQRRSQFDSNLRVLP